MSGAARTAESGFHLPGREAGLIAATLTVAGLFALRALSPKALSWPDATWNWLAMVSKLLLEALGAVLAFAASRHFPGADHVRRAWLGLAAGSLSFLGGQLMLADYQLLRGIDVPFPSPAEAFFLAAYPFLIASQLGFVRAFRQAGWPFGEPHEDQRRMMMVAGFALILVLPALQPIARSSEPLLDRTISVAYPLLDIVLLAPALLLARAAYGLRGGRAQRVWLALVAGIVCLVLGDILFAYQTSLHFAALDPVVDLLYLLAYGAFAVAPLDQLTLAKTSAPAS